MLAAAPLALVTWFAGQIVAASTAHYHTPGLQCGWNNELPAFREKSCLKPAAVTLRGKHLNLRQDMFMGENAHQKEYHDTRLAELTDHNTHSRRLNADLWNGRITLIHFKAASSKSGRARDWRRLENSSIRRRKWQFELTTDRAILIRRCLCPKHLTVIYRDANSPAPGISRIDSGEDAFN